MAAAGAGTAAAAGFAAAPVRLGAVCCIGDGSAGWCVGTGVASCDCADAAAGSGV